MIFINNKILNNENITNYENSKIINENIKIINKNYIKGTPQSGIIPEGSKFAYFAVYKFNYRKLNENSNKNRIELIEFVKSFINKMQGNNDIYGVIAFNYVFWPWIINNQTLLFDTAPYLCVFPNYGFKSDNNFDLYIHIHGNDKDNIINMFNDISNSLNNILILKKDEKFGYKYMEGRDLTGFIDGTANAHGDEERRKVAINEDGSSYVMMQRYIHNLEKWSSITEHDQETVIGRTKKDSIELNPLPTGSHVFHTDQGTDNFIVRHSLPYGNENDKEKGLWFTAYCKKIKTFDTLLKRMMGSEGFTKDMLLSFTTPVTGGYFFVPSIEMLNDL